MSKLVFNRDGGKTDEFGHLIALMRLIQGEVVEGLQVAANGAPNMSVNVPYGIAAIPVGSGATGYRYFAGLDATENVAIPTANGSNPRNDLVVLWVNKDVVPSQAFTNNSNNMLNISVVSGNPASTPADPSIAAIQAAIGAANPYIILARVTVGAGATQINSGNIADLRSLVYPTRIGANSVTASTIVDGVITAVKIANGTISQAKLDFKPNVTIGYKEILSTKSVPTVGARADVPDYNIAVTVPTGARLRVKFVLPQVYTTSDGTRHDFSIVDETGRVLQTLYKRMWSSGNGGAPMIVEGVDKEQTAGVHTYRLCVRATNATVTVYGNTNTLYAENTAIGLISVETF